MYSALKVSLYFVKKGIEEDLPVDQMKLQKLVYFAHGYHLAVYNEPLIEEDIQAWKYGPVVPEIYHAFKFYSNEPIQTLKYVSKVSGFGFFKVSKDETEFDRNALDSLNTSWKLLKQISGPQLSNWTHKEESPWSQYYKEKLNDQVIPNEDIKKYFKEFLDV